MNFKCNVIKNCIHINNDLTESKQIFTIVFTHIRSVLHLSKNRLFALEIN